MIRSLRTAALGMEAQQLHVDTIANNLANVNTTGFKKNSLEFQDLLYQTIQSGASDRRDGKEKPGEIQIGHGNKPISTFRSFSQGTIEETENPLDMAIKGRGFFQVQKSDGSFAYTRDGSFRVNGSGNIVTSSGLFMYPEISIPSGVSSLNISEDGVLSVLYDGQSESEEIGQVELSNFMNPAGLSAIGGNLYVETEASGRPNFGLPGEEGFGTLYQGYLEKSNVDVVREMVDLIVAQRTYEINSKMAMTNNLKR